MSEEMPRGFMALVNGLFEGQSIAVEWFCAVSLKGVAYR